MTWQGHWHGYGPWTGSRDAYGRERLRRPGRTPDDEQTRTFLSSSVPPMMTGHWLLRRDQTSRHRTWTCPVDAVAWLRALHQANPPMRRDDGRLAYLDLEDRAGYAEDALPRGVDVSWVYYSPSRALVSFAAVCCPNHFHPHIPCPLPPG